MAVYGITGSLALVANTASQVLCGVVSGGTKADGEICWLDVTMDAATAAQGVKIQLFRATGGIPTGTTYAINALNAAAQARASQMASAWVPPVTVTPTGLTVVKTWYLPPSGGVLIQEPLSREDYIIPGTTAWAGLQASTAAGVSPNLAFNLSWDE
jgi:hypothetical protein